MRISNKTLCFSEIPFNIQMFAGDKTEPATGKRREEERKRGNVPKSADLSSVVVLFAILMVLNYTGNDLMKYMSDYMRFVLSHAIFFQLDVANASQLINGLSIIALKCLGPILFIAVLAVIAVNIYQMGFMFSADRLFAFDFSRFNPFANFGNLFSWNSFGELGRSMLKIAVVSYVPYSTFRDKLPSIIRLINLEPLRGMRSFSEIAFWMVIKIIVLFLIISILDFYFQQWRYEENIKMSKEEIKEEFKQMEGDPKVKQKIREKQRKIATQKMMSEVPKATVVVTNPTHIAVAISYEEISGTAPKVVAMGTGLIAQKIKDIARENDVPIIENKPLAQTLYKMVDIGDVIPEELWGTVAELLAQVYKMRGKF
ncbi:MAG: flagellar biosynthesis protein FlhB [Candidatus Riflebacteria bacterium]|nr:flagellar biosynthesis protein FlhB [Candidatus Riflebacteria bacterium]